MNTRKNRVPTTRTKKTAPRPPEAEDIHRIVQAAVDAGFINPNVTIGDVVKLASGVKAENLAYACGLDRYVGLIRKDPR